MVEFWKGRWLHLYSIPKHASESYVMPSFRRKFEARLRWADLRITDEGRVPKRGEACSRRWWWVAQKNNMFFLSGGWWWFLSLHNWVYERFKIRVDKRPSGSCCQVLALFVLQATPSPSGRQNSVTWHVQGPFCANKLVRGFNLRLEITNLLLKKRWIKMDKDGTTVKRVAVLKVWHPTHGQKNIPYTVYRF